MSSATRSGGDGRLSLMAGALKFEGTAFAPFEGPGPVRLMLAQCTHRHAIRGVARHDEIPPASARKTCFGSGQLAVTIEQSKQRPLPGRRAPRCGAAVGLPRALFRALRAAAVAHDARRDAGPRAGLLLQRVAVGEGSQPS